MFRKPKSEHEPIRPSVKIQEYDFENRVVTLYDVATYTYTFDDNSENSVDLEVLHLVPKDEGKDGLAEEDVRKELSKFSDFITKIRSVNEIRVEGQVGNEFINELHKIAAGGAVVLTYRNYVARTPKPIPFPCNIFAKMQLNIFDSDLRGMDFSHCTQLEIVEVSSLESTVAQYDPMKMLNSLFENGSKSVVELHIIYQETVLLLIADRLIEIRSKFPKMSVLSTSVAAIDLGAPDKKMQLIGIMENQQSLTKPFDCAEFWFVDADSINDSDVVCPKKWQRSKSAEKVLFKPIEVPVVTCVRPKPKKIWKL